MEALVVQWLLSWEMDTKIQVVIFKEIVYISYSANILRKSLNPTILPPAASR